MPENAVLTPPITDAPEDQKLLETDIEDEFELDIRVSTYSKTFASPHATSACQSQCVGSCFCTVATCGQITCSTCGGSTCVTSCSTWYFICC